MASPATWISVAAVIITFSIYSYQRLVFWRFRQNAHLPQPTPSLLLGHLAYIDKYSKGKPQPFVVEHVAEDISRDIGSPDVCLLDLWPAGPTTLYIRKHEIAEQITKQTKAMPYSAPKGPVEFMMPLLGSNNMVFANGPKWKTTRKRFNPGFAPQHLMGSLPVIVDKTRPLLDRLDDAAASHQTIPIGPLITALTFDVIGAVALGTDMYAQLPTEKQSGLYRQYLVFLGLFANSNGSIPWFLEPILRARQWAQSRRVDEHLFRLIRSKHDDIKQGGGDHSKRPNDRSVLSLSLYDEPVLSAEVLQSTADQLKTFLFAGHDTTSSLIQWVIFEVTRHPRVLEKVRGELDSVFGPGDDIGPLYQMFGGADSKGEETLSRMPYLAAVIKETIRLRPPATTGRRMPKGTGFTIELTDGTRVLADDMVLFPGALTIQTDERTYGPTARDFIPERWLDNESGSIPPAAWRPFERGPRNCIGQDLALTEARVASAFLIRRFDFVKAGLGAPRLDDNAEPMLSDSGCYISDSRVPEVRAPTVKPGDDMMMQVKRRGEEFA